MKYPTKSVIKKLIPVAIGIVIENSPSDRALNKTSAEKK